MSRARLASILTVALLPSTMTAGLASAAPVPPGLHLDSGSPSAKEYAVPFDQARAQGAPHGGGGGGGTSAGPGAGLFGVGIRPPSRPTTRATGKASDTRRQAQPTSPEAGPGGDPNAAPEARSARNLASATRGSEWPLTLAIAGAILLSTVLLGLGVRRFADVRPRVR